MILADTTIWIDHLRRQNVLMQQFLDGGQVLMHPYIVAELALGSLHDRAGTLSVLDSLLQVGVAQLHEVRQMIEARQLYAKGVGLIDAHLIASCLMSPGIKFWTRDTRLRGVAKTLGIDAGLP